MTHTLVVNDAVNADERNDPEGYVYCSRCLRPADALDGPCPSVNPDLIVLRAISNLVAYNWADEEDDYNHEALEPGNSREGHIFRDLMLIQRWLETFEYPHVSPHIKPRKGG